MSNNIVAASPEMIDEINRGFEVLHKDGYEAKVVDGPNSDQFSIVFTFGESTQTMKFRKSDAGKKDGIADQIVDRLNI